MDIYSPKETFLKLQQKLIALNKQKAKPVRVAINGVEGTGKTCFAIALNQFLQNQSLESHHITIDGFHFDSNKRYQQGRDSAQGYYEDSFDELAFINKVLKSSQQNPPEITRATHNLETDEYISLAPESISQESFIISDGAYLFKSNFQNHWDLKIYLKCDLNTAKSRGARRDAQWLGGLNEAQEKFTKRYHAASKIYNQLNNPEQQADIIIDNTDFENPVIIKGL